MREDDWRWMGSMMNLTKYSYWANGNEGQGCAPGCNLFHGLVLNRVYNWEGFTKETPLPYICASGCAVGYAWRTNAKRCVKIVKDYGQKTQPDAALFCAKDNGRLLSIDSCDEFQGLNKDIWTKTPSLTQTYWMGYQTGGLQNYINQQRTSDPQSGPINSRGQIALQPGGGASCSNQDQLPIVGSSTSNKGLYGKITFVGEQDMKLDLSTEYSDSSLETSTSSWLCEKDRDWTCPSNYILFQESCYKILDAEVTAMAGHLQCMLEENAKVVEVSTLMQMKFLNSLAKSENKTSFWVNLRRHVNTMATSEDAIFFTPEDIQASYESSWIGGAASTEDCTEYVVDTFAQQTVDCNKNVTVICEKEQILEADKIFAIPSPKVFMPLDLISGFEDLSKVGEVIESKIAFTIDPSPMNKLNSAAHFMGIKDSYIDVTLLDNYFNQGLSVTAWIYIDQIQDQQNLVDTRPFDTGSDTFHNFYLYVKKSGSLIQLWASICDGVAVSDDAEDVGTCTLFASSSSTPIVENKWTYVAFTYDSYNKVGTLMINQIYGYEGSSSAMENKLFSYDTKKWLGTKLQGFGMSFKIGGRRAATNTRSFSGKLSCLQIYDQFLQPSQLLHLSKCPVAPDYEKFSECPSDYFLFRSHCYKLSTSQDVFSYAEYSCTTKKGKIKKVYT